VTTRVPVDVIAAAVVVQVVTVGLNPWNVIVVPAEPVAATTLATVKIPRGLPGPEINAAATLVCSVELAQPVTANVELEDKVNV
jgi:hypothetical protein